MKTEVEYWRRIAEIAVDLLTFEKYQYYEVDNLTDKAERMAEDEVMDACEITMDELDAMRGYIENGNAYEFYKKECEQNDK